MMIDLSELVRIENALEIIAAFPENVNLLTFDVADFERALPYLVDGEPHKTAA